MKRPLYEFERRIKEQEENVRMAEIGGQREAQLIAEAEAFARRRRIADILREKELTRPEKGVA